MLSKAFEWYRIVSPRPTSQTIDNRTASVRDLIGAIDEGEDRDLVLAYAAGVIVGFEGRVPQDSPDVQSLVKAVRAHESAFPQDLSENDLELRYCASVALGEIMVRNGDQNPDTTALLVASLLRSGLFVRPWPRGNHLKRLLADLGDAAAKVLISGALRRRRHVTVGSRFESIQEPTEPLSVWKSLVPELTTAMKEIAEQIAIEREELNVLWWMFSGASSKTGETIASMTSGAAALCCGAELGGQCLLPPASSLEAMVRRAYETGRRPREMTDKSIEELAADWNDDLLSGLVPDEDARRFARAYPTLLPLSWLCDRLFASKGVTGWTGEFEQMTGIPRNYRRPPADWAIQAFRERVAYRIYADALKG